MNRAVPEKTEILLRYGDLAALPGFRVLRFDGGGAAEGFSSVSIDSRTVRPGALFAALAGSEADGHAFVAGAFLRGAAAALVDETKIARYDLENAARKSGAVLVALGDTLWGLQEAARVYLARFPRLLKIAVTGSSGKTTVKEIAAAMIGAEKNVFFNEGNLNSETGLPLSVFGVRSFHEAGVFEMGMNRRGEIAALARVLEPHIALITNIGPAHIGYIGSIAAIVEEKKAVFSRFTGTETALVPEDEPYREDLARGVRGNVVYYGPRSLEDLGDVFDRGLDGAEITWEGVSAPFSLPGK
ncbi:MAG: Mur ligase domain-containing protein, partial [Spirochaetaceae bacterium]|nr:Mur ligase domain-containing protein [Spirochaetaceae bacterium]